MRDPNLLYNTKAVLKYLINNGNAVQTVNTIALDFYNYTQVHIPFFELGYSFLLTFLKSIPDVLHVDPISFEVRPPGTFYRSVLPNPSQFVHRPMTLPLILPWIQSHSQDIHESTSTISQLGPRTYGDGQCSSSDSIATDNEVESHELYKQNQGVAPAIVPNDDPKNDCGDVAINDIKNVDVRFDCTPSDDDFTDVDKNIIKNVDKGVDRFNSALSDDDFTDVDKNIIKNIDNGVVRFECTPSEDDAIGGLHKSQSTSSVDMISVKFDDNAPPPYSAEKLFDYDYDYNLSSPEEKVPIPSEDDEEDEAIPFMFDDKINLLSSCFFNGNYGTTFKTTDIDDILKVGNVYELYVSEVNSPYKFWFQLNEEIPNPVEELQERLNECYAMTDCIPELIKQEHMQNGYACAALYAKFWHRGEIIGQVEDGKVSVFFVDYGTVDQVAIGGIRYLLNSFCVQPKLCHRGTLDYIKPRNLSQRWTVDATSFLISLVENKKLTAGITDIDRKNNSVRMYIIDTEANINVNCSLVYEMFAYPEDPRQHIADVVPSFEALETGQHASFSKVVNLLQHNYDYEELLHKSVVEEFDCHIPSHVSKEEANKRMKQFMTKKEEGRKIAKARDAKLFLEMFNNIISNPFLNGTLRDKIVVNTTNPFSD
ncbi:uncharacterized protein LOC119068840 isoform X2 [Bradysia coprophila]|uniref:uncharacterized protein LOC119068840 isoform X2 n=1 Tax=Bradysia coprophila TaxID=38358 RepID=UPI00187D95F8|nr:uncharacterized protein LOC119068840 isoform X2 [Bradysia coprophila]